MENFLTSQLEFVAFSMYVNWVYECKYLDYLNITCV